MLRSVQSKMDKAEKSSRKINGCKTSMKIGANVSQQYQNKPFKYHYRCSGFRFLGIGAELYFYDLL